MRGKTSYKEYLKTTLYDAFVRHSTMRLAGEWDEPDFKKFLKLWRDQVIRKLSLEGRVSEANDYTRYIDFLIQVYIEKFGAKNLTRKKKNEILRDIENGEERKHAHGEPYYDVSRLREELGLKA